MDIELGGGHIPAAVAGTCHHVDSPDLAGNFPVLGHGQRYVGERAQHQESNIAWIAVDLLDYEVHGMASSFAT